MSSELVADTTNVTNASLSRMAVNPIGTTAVLRYNPRVFPTRLVCCVMVACFACANYSCGAGSSRNTAAITIELERDSLPADGFATTQAVVKRAGRIVPADLSVLDGKRIVRLEGLRVRATVNPGRATIQARFGTAKATVQLITTPSYSDRSGDGTPDFLRLDDLKDREAFADSFTYLAEAQYFRDPEQLPIEISDCSALIRYAYRETLREHDSEWARTAGIRHAAMPDQPGKYHYPFTPLGAKLFRNVAGPFRASDVAGGSFSEFADAECLRRFNTHFISREIRLAQRGDLLFYKQPAQRSPAHAMIFIAASQFEGAGDDRVVYHTGPAGREKGEIRRPTIQELLNHPQPQWRPSPGNSNFLGVYRWNILRQES